MSKVEKLSLGDIVLGTTALRYVYYENAKDVLGGAMEQLKERKMGLKLKFRLMKLKNVFEREFADYEKLRVELIHKYGEEKKDENGNTVTKVAETKQADFYKDLGEILKQSTEFAYARLTDEEVEEFLNMEIELDETSILVIDKLFFENSKFVDVAAPQPEGVQA